MKIRIRVRIKIRIRIRIRNKNKNKLHSVSSCIRHPPQLPGLDYYTNRHKNRLNTQIGAHEQITDYCTNRQENRLNTQLGTHESSLNSRNQESTVWPWRGPFHRIARQQRITISPLGTISKTRNLPSGPGEDHYTASLASKGLLSPLGTCTPSSSTSTQQYILFSNLFSTSSSAPLLQHISSAHLFIFFAHIHNRQGLV